MIRKIKRSIARENIQNRGIKAFGKYSPETVLVRDKRTGKQSYQDVMRSYFARTWRNWAYDPYYEH